MVHNLELTYDYWTAGTSWVIPHVNDIHLCLDEILHSILPEELCKGSPSGFAITGHLGDRDDIRVWLPLILGPSAHMNLNKEYLPYKHIIGQIVLDESLDSSNSELPLMSFTTEKSYD